MHAMHCWTARPESLFNRSAKRYGLTVSVKKTEMLFQPAPGSPYMAPNATIEGQPLKAAENLCYLGSTISNDATIDAEIKTRVNKAGAAFGRWKQRLRSSHDVSIRAKMSVYNAVVIPTLLNGCETWTLHRRHTKRLDSFHMRCLRRILGIQWQDRIPTTEMLQRGRSTGLPALQVRHQLRWAGHLVRMGRNRLPKPIFFGELAQGKRPIGMPKKRYKGALKANLKRVRINVHSWQTDGLDRPSWRARKAKRAMKKQ